MTSPIIWGNFLVRDNGKVRRSLQNSFFEWRNIFLIKYEMKQFARKEITLQRVVLCKNFELLICTLSPWVSRFCDIFVLKTVQTRQFTGNGNLKNVFLVNILCAKRSFINGGINLWLFSETRAHFPSPTLVWPPSVIENWSFHAHTLSLSLFLTLSMTLSIRQYLWVLWTNRHANFFY